MNLVKRAKWMKERGAKVVVFCVDGSSIYDKAKEDLLRIERVERNKKYGDRVNAKVVARLCDKHNLNVLWIRDSRDMSLAGLVKKYSGKSLTLLYQQAMQLGVKKKDFVHTRRFSRIDLWISPLQYLADQVVEKTNYPEERVHVVPLGLQVQELLYQRTERSSARMQLHIDQNATVMGVIGRIDPKKGQLFIVHAVAELRKKHHDLHLLFMGDKTQGEAEKYEHEVRSAIKKFDMEDVVHWKPFSEKVGTFYGAVDVVAMASDAETYGTVTIEAMLFGCRIIGTNTAGTPNLLGWGEYGELYTPGNIKEFCQAYETMMIDEEQSEDKARRAQEFAKDHFDHYKEMEEIERLLKEAWAIKP